MALKKLDRSPISWFERNDAFFIFYASYLSESRKDFAISPPQPTLLGVLKDNGKEIIGIGKISDIFFNSGKKSVSKIDL